MKSLSLLLLLLLPLLASASYRERVTGKIFSATVAEVELVRPDGTCYKIKHAAFGTRTDLRPGYQVSVDLNEKNFRFCGKRDYAKAPTSVSAVASATPSPARRPALKIKRR